MNNAKILRYLVTLIIGLAATMNLPSCSKDAIVNINNSIEGMWKGSYNRVIEFSGSNTVFYYGNVTEDPNAWSKKKTEPVPGHNGWYYLPANKRTYTYVMEGNKIFTTYGDILTYDEGRLLIDGYSDYYTRW